MRRELAILSVVLVALAGCGGGGGGVGSVSDSRTVVADYRPGQATTLTDPLSNASITMGATALSSVGKLEATFSEQWLSRPASPAAVPQTVARLKLPTNLSPSGGILLSAPPNGCFWAWSCNGSYWHVVSAIAGRSATLDTAEACKIAPNTSELLIGYIKNPCFGGQAPKHVASTGATRSQGSYVVKLGGSGPDDIRSVQSGSTVLMVHGIFDSPSPFKKMGNYLLSVGVAENVYGFGYNSAQSISQSGVELANLIKQIPGRAGITIVAHSMGGLVASYAIEHEMAQVGTLVMLGTPRQGTNIAQSGTLPRALINDRLNDSEDVIDGWFDWSVNIPSVADMLPGSAFLQTLNQPNGNSRYQIRYLAIAGSHSDWAGGLGLLLTMTYYPMEMCDGLVPGTSLLTYPYSQSTLGAVGLASVPYNHGELKRSQDCFEILANQLMLFNMGIGPKVEVGLTNNGWATDIGWEWQLTARNTGQSNLQMTTRTLLAYDRSGIYIGTRWYTPSPQGGDRFTDTPANWGIIIPPVGSHTMHVHTGFDGDKNYGDTPDSRHAMTVVVVDQGDLLAAGNFYPFNVVTRVVLCDKNGSPPNPPTRAVIEKGVDRAVKHLSAGRATSPAGATGRSGR